MAPVAQQYWSVDDAAAASVLEHLEQMQTNHGPLPPPPSPVNAQHCNSRDFAGLLGALSATRSGTAGAPSPLGCNGGERERKRRRVWGEHLRRRSQARPGTPSPVQSYTRLGSTRCHSHALASIPRWGRPVWLPRPACARNRCESEKGVAGKEQRRGGHSDAALYREMLGRRRTQAGAIIRTDSQRNVSRGNRAIFRGQAPHPIFEIFATPRAIRMGPIGGKHRSVHLGSPATRSGPTIPGGGKRGRRAGVRPRHTARRRVSPAAPRRSPGDQLWPRLGVT